MARRPAQKAAYVARTPAWQVRTPKTARSQPEAAPCPIHGTACAYPGPHPEACPFCHCTWARITADAVPPVWGYGQTATEHLAAHMAGRRRRPRRTQ
jgi:hypothetical protein